MTTDPLDMTLTEKIAVIKSSVTPLDLADMLEIPVVGDKIVSPFNPDERTASCHLYEDGWYDFGTGQHGDVVDLYCKLTGVSVGKAVNRLLEGAQRLDVDPDRVRRVAVEPPDLTLRFQDFHGSGFWQPWAAAMKPLRFEDLRRLHNSLQIGLTPDGVTMAIAHWQDHVVRGIKLRSITGAKSAVPGSTFACGLYQPFLIAHDQAIITEGETDCWALQATGIEADILSLPSGAGLWKDAWLAQLDPYQRIYTAFDNDEAGKRATDKVERAIRNWRPVEGMEYNDRWRQLKVPSTAKDVREALANGWKPRLREGG